MYVSLPGVLAATNAPDTDLADNVVPVPRPVLNEGDAPQALLWGHIIVVIDDDNAADAAAFAAEEEEE